MGRRKKEPSAAQQAQAVRETAGKAIGCVIMEGDNPASFLVFRSQAEAAQFHEAMGRELPTGGSHGRTPSGTEYVGYSLGNTGRYPGPEISSVLQQVIDEQNIPANTVHFVWPGSAATRLHLDNARYEAIDAMAKSVLSSPQNEIDQVVEHESGRHTQQER